VTTTLPEDEASLCDDLVLALLRRARLLEERLREGGDDGNGGETAKKMTTTTKMRVVGPSKMMLGSLNEAVRTRLLQRHHVRLAKTPAAAAKGVGWEFWGTWLFRVEELASLAEKQVAAKGQQQMIGRGLELGLNDGMRWDVVRREDIRVVQSRTSIPRQEWVSLLDLFVCLPDCFSPFMAESWCARSGDLED